MDEKVKNKDAEPNESKTDDLQQGLEETFPGSDPVAATQPGDGTEAAERKKPGGKDE